MKQYIMGMLTGASLILCAVMFIGATDKESYGHYQAFALNGEAFFMDTKNGELFQYVVNEKTGKTSIIVIYSPRLGQSAY